MAKVELKNQGTSSTDSTDTAGTQTVLPNYRLKSKGNKVKVDTSYLYRSFKLFKKKKKYSQLIHNNIIIYLVVRSIRSFYRRKKNR